MTDWGRSALMPVTDLDGVGPRTGAALAELGLRSMQELSALTPEQADSVADLVAGLSREGMRRVVDESQFHLLGQSADVAGALVAAGYRDLLALLAAPTSRIQDVTGLDETQALALQVQAARTGLTFQGLLHVVDGAGAAIARPVVEVGNAGLGGHAPVATRTGDADGWVLTPPLRRDRAHRMHILADGHRRMVRLVAPGGLILRSTIVLQEPPRRAPMQAQKPLVLGRGQFVFEDVAIADAEGHVFRVGVTEGGQTSLHAAQRSLIPYGVVTGVLRLPAADVPGTEGDFVCVDAGTVRPATDHERDDALLSRGGALIGRWSR